jgi:hypothetical protein
MPELEYDSRLIERLARVYEASAMVHIERVADDQPLDHEAQRSRWSQREMLAASSFAIAASYWSLIEPRKAALLYRKAAGMYRSLGHSYAMVLALASGGRREIPEMLSEIDEAPAVNPQAVAFAMVANEVSRGERNGARGERLAAQWHYAGNVPIGRLGIPLDHYARCAQAMHLARPKKGRERFFAEAANYVRRAAEVLRSASHDRFHWFQLRSAIMPAEPEAVAMTTSMSEMSHSMFGIPISQMPHLDPQGRLLVTIGENMRQAGASQE